MPEERLTQDSEPTLASLLKSESVVFDVKNSSSGDEVARFLKLLKDGKAKDAKDHLRSAEWPLKWSRADVWTTLVKKNFAKQVPVSDQYYEDTVRQMFGKTGASEGSASLPTFVDKQHLHSYDLNEEGRAVTARIIQVLGYSFPAITYAPAVYPCTALLLHFMSEKSTYVCMNALVAGKYLSQTRVAYETQWRALRPLCKKYARSAFNFLSRIEPNDLIYERCSWYLLEELPLSCVVRLLDCLLMEGPKIMYRFSLALLLLFVKEKGRSLSRITNAVALDSEICRFCRDSFTSSTKLTRCAFSIRGFARSEILRLREKTEDLVKSGVFSSSATPNQLVRSRSTEVIPTSASQNNIEMLSHTLTIKQLRCIWSWLPLRITMYQPIMLYTTEEHGCSLTTFFNKCERHEPTIVMIKTSDDDIFGAYCSAAWWQRNAKNESTGFRNTYFGTGESFLFQLYPETKKFPWVGIDTQGAVPHSAELFMVADTTMFSIGGGNGQGIWVDADIRFGKTEKCDTFGNPPLGGKSHFEIKVMEVYGFESLLG